MSNTPNPNLEAEQRRGEGAMPLYARPGNLHTHSEYCKSCEKVYEARDYEGLLTELRELREVLQLAVGIIDPDLPDDHPDVEAVRAAALRARGSV